MVMYVFALESVLDCFFVSLTVRRESVKYRTKFFSESEVVEKEKLVKLIALPIIHDPYVII